MHPPVGQQFTHQDEELTRVPLTRLRAEDGMQRSEDARAAEIGIHTIDCHAIDTSEAMN